MRCGIALLAATATAMAAPAAAQEWSVQSGATARVEYNDNYFFTSADPQSALTGTMTPFVTAARKTETTDVSALASVGANKVWGPSPTVDYLSGRVQLDGTVREPRSTWSGSASLGRSANLQYETGQAGTVLVLAFTNAAAGNAAYSYALTERWSMGAATGAYGNRYDGVANGATLSNNHGYYASGNTGYGYSDRTQFTFAVGYSGYFSSITRSSEVSITIGAAHQFSPQLTISASVGGFRSITEATQDAPGGRRRLHQQGGLYGGNISYVLSERTQIVANLSENLAPGSSGTLNRNDSAAAALTHRFSDRITGRLGATYTRTAYPATLTSSSTDNYYLAEVGMSYLLAGRWNLDAGYRYARARYGQSAGEPRSNLVFVSIAYNWPGASGTDWVGQHPNIQGLPGAGTVSLPGGSSGAPVPVGPADEIKPPEPPAVDVFVYPETGL